MYPLNLQRNPQKLAKDFQNLAQSGYTAWDGPCPSVGETD